MAPGVADGTGEPFSKLTADNPVRNAAHPIDADHSHELHFCRSGTIILAAFCAISGFCVNAPVPCVIEHEISDVHERLVGFYSMNFIS